MPSLNRCEFIGHLGGDPEVRYTPNGALVASFSLAVNRAWKGKDGEWQEETTWVNCVAWGDVGERLSETFRKGRLVFVEGRLEVQKWNDKETGEPRTRTLINVNRGFALDKRDESTNGTQNVARAEPPVAATTGNDLDDLPF